MSFILDALKKSENERQRQIGPSLADVPVRRRKDERPWWAFALAALLVVNLGVLVIVLVRSDGAADAQPIPSQQPQVESAPAPQPSVATSSMRVAPAAPTPAPAIDPPVVSSNPAVRSLADEAITAVAEEDADLTQPGFAAAANVPAGPPMVRPIEPPSVAPLPSRPNNEPQPADNEMLPTHGSLVAGGTRLPDMRLDIHVYSPNPPDRFVFVNMRKYTEGQTLSEGPSVERITADGVVLNQQGLRFLLPRQ